ncbi:hypothetical protein MKY04_05165 [Lysinibacillus telephonicus]
MNMHISIIDVNDGEYVKQLVKNVDFMVDVIKKKMQFLYCPSSLLKFRY